MVSRVLNLGLRAWEWLMALLVMALIGNMIADANSGNPSVVNFGMFCAVFAMLTLLYLTAIAVNESFIGHGALPLALDALNSLFWFCAAVALAAELGVHSCSNKTYTKNNRITNGADNRNKRCTEAQASTAFLWFGWAAFTASAVFSSVGARGVNLRAPGIRRGGPAMSQV
ncbi:putative non-classical export protein [Phaeomoniella chlamydospora]|uniref:Putative non-classical export protein n=1 Tax=Phaeomoniella chlamydospora TaxID=158046 RepID=A0A0G2EH74_PHACM|nr:putative non-classical export protein [Phaeomoniella chlamydospora]